jgi:hypothetical protein
MIDLNKEAEELYPEPNPYILGISVGNDIKRKAFIAGANSRYVQAEKLKFAIEQLYKFRESTFGKGKNIIIELEQQLKQLEDE